MQKEMEKMDMLEARPIDALLALVRMEESIQEWKTAVADLVRARVETMHIAQGPFRWVGPPIPGPEPPFGGCERDVALRALPLSGDLDFDIDTHVQQFSGFLLGLHYGLLHDRGGDLNP
jgi:hypothetical protein